MANWFTDATLAPTVPISETGYTITSLRFYVPTAGGLGTRTEKKTTSVESWEVRGLDETTAKAHAVSIRSDTVSAEAKATGGGAWTVFATEVTEGAWVVV